MTCRLFTYGDAYGDDRIAPFDDQVTWLNGQVEEVVREIQARSATPPVIVIFSDHGTRFNADDHPEMYRSLLLASTPGHGGLFPNDASPVNYLNRLLNAYTSTPVPLAGEETYWLDSRQVDKSGAFGFQRVDTLTVPGD